MSVLRPFIINPSEDKKENATKLLSIVKNENGTNYYYFKDSTGTQYKKAFIVNGYTGLLSTDNQLKSANDLDELSDIQKELFIKWIQTTQYTLDSEIWGKDNYQTFKYDGVEYLFDANANTVSNDEQPFLVYGNIVGFRSDEGVWTILDTPVRAMVIGPIVEPIQGILKKDVQFDPSPMMLTNDMLNSASTDSFKDVLFPPERPVTQLTDSLETVDTPGLAQSVDATSPEPTSTPTESDEESDSDDDDGASGGETDSGEVMDDTFSNYTSKTAEYTKKLRDVREKLRIELDLFNLQLANKKNEIDKLPPGPNFNALSSEIKRLTTLSQSQASTIMHLVEEESKERKKGDRIAASNDINTMKEEIQRIDGAYKNLNLLESTTQRELENMTKILESLQVSSPPSSDPSSSAGTISTPAQTINVSKPIALPSVPPTSLPTGPATGSTTISTPPPEPGSASGTNGQTGATSTPDSGTQSGAGSASSTVETIGQTTTPTLPAQLNWILVDPNPFPILDSNALFNQGTVGVSNFVFFGIQIQARKIDSLHFALQQQFPRLRTNSDRRRTPVTSGFVVFFQYKDDGSAVLSLVGGTKVPISIAQYTSLLRQFPNSKGKHYRDESLADGLGGQEIVAMREANGGVRPMWYARFSHY